MREKSKILLLTLVMLFLIPISCRMDEIQRVSNQESEFVSEARRSFYANQVVLGKFSKISNELKWSKSFFTLGKEGVVVEIPFEPKPGIMTQTKINDLINQDVSSFNRVLMKLKDGKWTIFHIVISTKEKSFDNYDSKFNYYRLNENFNGFITSSNLETNEITARKYINGKNQNQQNVLAREDDEMLCTFYGQFNNDGSFTPWYLIYCTGTGGNDTGNNGGDYGGGGGGDGDGNGNNNSGEMTMPPPPTTPIPNMLKFLKCFDTNQPANLTIFAQTITSSPPGHAFISITQGNNTMTFGFYPQNGFPGNVSGPGIFGDDSQHAYSYGWNIGMISSTELVQIINLAINYSNSNYVLNSNNCANFTLGVLNIVGVNNNNSGFQTPNDVAGLIQSAATMTNGLAAPTQRTCN